jgi:N-acetylglutamate synthase-like GNAT family acetyltransferase
LVAYRPAAARDARAIRALIRQVGINPLGLDWRRFLVAVDERDAVIGCGQVKPHADGTRELASIAVLPERQGQGIGQELVRRLLVMHPRPLYLTCRASLETFYGQFGFRRAAPETLPPYFRRVRRAFHLLRRFLPGLEELLVMANRA